MPRDARAGAWTLASGHTNVFSSVITSQARAGYDAAGHPSQPLRFEKMLAQARVEYGLRNGLTVFVQPEYVRGDITTPAMPRQRDSGFGLAGGARVRLLKDFGVLSVEASVRAASAFGLSVTSHGQGGNLAETRFLYGAGFKLLARDAFIDIGLGYRWASWPRPDEVPLDVTTGVWVTPSWMVMAQSFNLVAAGATPSFGYYRSHKVELSLVNKVSRHFRLQTGMFFSPAGRNVLKEEGAHISLWTQL